MGDPDKRRDRDDERNLGGTVEAAGNPASLRSDAVQDAERGPGPFAADPLRDAEPYGEYERRGATAFHAGAADPGADYAPGEGALAHGGGEGATYDNLAQAEAAQSDRVDPAARQADEEARLGAGEDEFGDMSETPDDDGERAGGRGQLKEEGER